MRGDSPEAVAEKLYRYPELCGLQGPTISPVYSAIPDKQRWYAISLVVRQSHLQTAIERLRNIGGSGVVALPARFIFEEEPERWKRLKAVFPLSVGKMPARKVKSKRDRKLIRPAFRGGFLIIMILRR